MRNILVNFSRNKLLYYNIFSQNSRKRSGTVNGQERRETIRNGERTGTVNGQERLAVHGPFTVHSRFTVRTGTVNGLEW
jgi:hypothetical protein